MAKLIRNSVECVNHLLVNDCFKLAGSAFYIYNIETPANGLRRIQASILDDSNVVLDLELPGSMPFKAYTQI